MKLFESWTFEEVEDTFGVERIKITKPSRLGWKLLLTVMIISKSVWKY